MSTKTPLRAGESGTNSHTRTHSRGQSRRNRTKLFNNRSSRLDQVQLDELLNNPEELVPPDSCCGCCDVFYGMRVVSGWTLAAAVVYFVSASFFIAGRDMPDDSDKTAWRVVLGLNLIPGLVRAVCGGVGFWWPSQLAVLIVLDDPLKRPDDYNDYEVSLNVWNMLILWTPIVCDPLLCYSWVIYFVDISENFLDFWTPTGSNGSDWLKVIWVTATIFMPAAIDMGVCYYWYTVFKKFVEETFKNKLWACYCPRLYDQYEEKHNKQCPLKC